MPLSKIIQRITQTRLSTATLAISSSATRNHALHTIAQTMLEHQSDIIKANHKDLEAGKHLNTALLDRLEITHKNFHRTIESVHQVAELPDPIGGLHNIAARPSGIRVGKMRVPIGVVGMIYESRPNVTQEAASLCLKSGNGCVLRGGSEALHSNLAIGAAIHQGLRKVGLPETLVSIIPTVDRQAVSAMLKHPDIDVLIPRGGKALIKKVMEEATMPVIKHLEGNCHVYVDAEAQIDMAVNITDNAKSQRYGTCNTTESLLVAAPISDIFLPKIAALFSKKQIEIRGCPETCSILPQAKPATEDDWFTEYLAPIISIKVVADINEAIAHINHYGSKHTDTIITEHHSHAMRFLREVDSSSVMVNASTRFADGFEYGLGAEIGVSTNKIHARGPVGLEGLTSEKWVVLGTGEIRE